jgi:hypothetical protein
MSETPFASNTRGLLSYPSDGRLLRSALFEETSDRRSGECLGRELDARVTGPC